MSAPSASGGRPPRESLAERLRPRSEERRGSGDLRLVETIVLVLVGIFLAVATINDVGRQAGINHRLVADLRTWRDYTGHQYKNLQVDQELLGSSTKREVVCGNTSPGAPKARTQLCLMVEGPVMGGRREVHGGWYLPPGSDDQRTDRYACFGAAVAAGICPR
jgi:hypothetical protein